MPHLLRKRWIKLWTQETLHGTTFTELEPAQRAVWFGELLMAGDSPEPGKICVTKDIGFTPDQRAAVLHVSVELLEETEVLLIQHNKITKNGNNIIEIVNWDVYQTTDRTEYMAEYMKEYRSKQKCKLTSKTANGKPVDKLVTRQDKTRVDNTRQEDIDNKDTYSPIFDFWNAKNVIVHKKLTHLMVVAIEKALNDYSPNEIINAIKVYSDITKGEQYWFNYKWTLCEFLTRKNALPVFVNTGAVYSNFLIKNNKISESKPTQTARGGISAKDYLKQDK